jgi:hypothetical protein
MRKGFHTLHALVRDTQELDVFAGRLFVTERHRSEPRRATEPLREKPRRDRINIGCCRIFLLAESRLYPYHQSTADRPQTLSQDPQILQKMSVDMTAHLDRTERLLRQLLASKTRRKSEQLSREQLALFAEAGISLPDTIVEIFQVSAVDGAGSRLPPA